MKPVLVNFTSHRPGRGFEGGRARLLQSLERHGWPGDVLAFTPTDLSVPANAPFSFKPAAVMAAARKGYTQILWADASVVLLKQPKRTLQYLASNPVLFTPHSEPMKHSAGLWASDRCLAKHRLTRDQAMAVPSFVAGFLGFNLERAGSLNFLTQWWAASRDNESFVGGWGEDTAPVSSDPRCQGHRHDQVTAGILNHRLGLPTTQFGELICDYSQKDTEWSFDYV